MDIPQLALPTSLDEAQIKTLPSKAFYIPNFLTGEEEQILLQKVSRFQAHSRFGI